MNMKQYLIDTFRFNDWANRKMLAAAKDATDKDTVAAIFSHLIYVQDRWLKRVNNDPTESQIEDLQRRLSEHGKSSNSGSKRVNNSASFASIQSARPQVSWDRRSRRETCRALKAFT